MTAQSLHSARRNNGIKVHILGSSRHYGELLAKFLKENLQIQCEWAPQINETYEKSKCNNKCNNKCFVLWDCKSLSLQEIKKKLNSICRSGKIQHDFALMNLKPDIKFETDVLRLGIKGVFYENDALSSFSKGIPAMLNGDLWFSREVMIQSLHAANKNSNHSQTSRSSVLTPREKEILKLIVLGNKNAEISESLHISTHTVKTHINNIFGKIKVPNRVQASLWAAKNLRD